MVHGYMQLIEEIVILNGHGILATSLLYIFSPYTGSLRVHANLHECVI